MWIQNFDAELFSMFFASEGYLYTGFVLRLTRLSLYRICSSPHKVISIPDLSSAGEPFSNFWKPKAVNGDSYPSLWKIDKSWNFQSIKSHLNLNFFFLNLPMMILKKTKCYNIFIKEVGPTIFIESSIDMFRKELHKYFFRLKIGSNIFYLPSWLFFYFPPRLWLASPAAGGRQQSAHLGRSLGILRWQLLHVFCLTMWWASAQQDHVQVIHRCA
jgi:hypothetical protein